MKGAIGIDKGHPPLTCIRSFGCAARHPHVTRAANEPCHTRAAILVPGRQALWTAVKAALAPDVFGTGAAIRTNAMNISPEMAARGMGAVAALVDLAEVCVERGLPVEPFALRARSQWGYVLTEAGRQPTDATEQVRTWWLQSGRNRDPALPGA
jgi:DNA-binding transcriptional LysR family regulator